MKDRPVFLALLVIASIVVAIATLVALDWDRVRERIADGSERTRVSLFRMGELMSIAAALEPRAGRRPELRYETIAGERVLEIAYGPPAGSEDEARAIAIAALGLTDKREQVDVVVVRFATSHRFERSALDERPKRDRIRPDPVASERRGSSTRP